MASTDIQYNCGCGYKTRKLEAAVNHCDEKSHVITVQGNIYPDVAKQSPRNAPPKLHKFRSVLAPEPNSDFLAMKKRLQNK